MKKITLIIAATLTTSTALAQPRPMAQTLGGLLAAVTIPGSGPEANARVIFNCAGQNLTSFTLNKQNPERRFGSYNGGMCKLNWGILTLKFDGNGQPNAVTFEGSLIGFMLGANASQSASGYRGIIAHW